MIKIGCSGFPVGKKTYEAKLALAEVIEADEKPPRAATLAKWRSEAKPEFEFVVRASHIVSHSKKASAHARIRVNGVAVRPNRVGYFQDTPEVAEAATLSLIQAKILDARIILFSMPPGMGAQADNIGRLQKFFGSLKGAQGFLLAWEPPLSWPESLIQSMSKSLSITPATNPLARRVKTSAPFNYFRLGDSTKTYGTHKFSEDELRHIKLACDKPISYVIFNNGPYAFENAVRFSALCGPS